jgi:adenylosuccinate synthase
VTGRPRRCGWFDAPLLRYTALINNFDTLVITKLDVLDHLDRIPVCTEYREGERVLSEMPAVCSVLGGVDPVYECLPGWQTDTSQIKMWSELPPAARTYIDFLEKQCDVEVGCISMGPERNQTIVKPGSNFERLTNH